MITEGKADLSFTHYATLLPHNAFQTRIGVYLPASHPEPLLLPKLRSYFADFPEARYLLARVCSTRTPDAVIGTAYASTVCYPLRNVSVVPASIDQPLVT